ncbi:MAG: hypothetical protein GXP62_09295 [Oligoflexia bacterium]|nr:hypothetical protein [Oligoflexia bacterium]
MTRPPLAAFLSLLLTACPQDDGAQKADGPPTLEQRAIAKGCPTMSTLAGDYLLVQGNTPDHKNRFRIIDDGDGSFTMWYVDGGFGKRVMDGVKRGQDVRFTEIPDARKKAAFQAGEEPLKRVYVEPRIQQCALRVTRLDVNRSGGKDIERGSPLMVEFVRFPKTQEVTFHPCDGPAFIYDAAKSYKVAAKQLKDQGAPRSDGALGEQIPVAAWTDAAADGADTCTFDMDLYFDDLPLPEGGKAVPVGDVVAGKRHWFVPAWKAPYSGNHNFELYRYKTCDGSRELVGVSCLEAVLH